MMEKDEFMKREKNNDLDFFSFKSHWTAIA